MIWIALLLIVVYAFLKYVTTHEPGTTVIHPIYAEPAQTGPTDRELRELERLETRFTEHCFKTFELGNRAREAELKYQEAVRKGARGSELMQATNRRDETHLRHARAEREAADMEGEIAHVRGRLGV